jgi:hypothetical protein
MAKARALLADGVNSRDPEWTWWVADAELAWHDAHAMASIGEGIAAVDLFRQAVDLRPSIHRRSRYNDLAHLLDALVRVARGETPRKFMRSCGCTTASGLAARTP